MTDSSRLPYLFNKYLQRKSSPKEVEELIQLLQQTGADESLTEPMQDLWRELKNDKTEHSVDWNKMFTQIRNSEEDLLALYRRRNYHRKRGWWLVAAAILFLFAGTGVYWFNKVNSTENSKGPPVNTAGHQQQQTGKRHTIHLSDGSTVVLNADSKLDYPSAFNGKTREVYLVGEGYFDVLHNHRQSFLVHAGKITTKVLGTTFDIKAYPADEAIEITVKRGKVQVLNENKNMGLVTANHQISFIKKTGQYVQKPVDVKAIFAWKPSEIVFNDITMEEAVNKVVKRFNMTVYFVNPAIKDCRITATFSEDDQLEEILSVICTVSKASYSVENNKIVINGKGCK
jgi:transmembrane sensor